MDGGFCACVAKITDVWLYVLIFQFIYPSWVKKWEWYVYTYISTQTPTKDQTAMCNHQAYSPLYITLMSHRVICTHRKRVWSCMTPNVLTETRYQHKPWRICFMLSYSAGYPAEMLTEGAKSWRVEDESILATLVSIEADYPALADHEEIA